MTNALVQLDDDGFTAPVVASFDYAALAPEQATIIKTEANLLRRDFRKTLATIIEAGHRLKRVKAILGHGSFGPWLAAEFGMTPRTAERYIQAAEVAPDKIDTVSHLPLGLFHQLAAPAIPDEVRAEIFAEAEKGPIPEEEVKARLSCARAEARHQRAEAARERKLSPEQRKRRNAREKRNKEKAAAEKQCRETEEAARFERGRRAVDDFVGALDGDGRDRLRAAVGDLGPYEIWEAIRLRLEPEART